MQFIGRYKYSLRAMVEGNSISRAAAVPLFWVLQERKIGESDKHWKRESPKGEILEMSFSFFRGDDFWRQPAPGKVP